MWWLLADVAGGVRGLSDSGATNLRVCGDEVKVVVVALSADTNGDVRGDLVELGATDFMTLGPKDFN